MAIRPGHLLLARAALGAAVLAAAPAAAQDCGYARRNLEQYRASCAAVDGCAQMGQAQEFVRRSCGAAPAPRTAPPPAPPRYDAGPAPRHGTGRAGIQSRCHAGSIRFVSSSVRLPIAGGRYCTDPNRMLSTVQTIGSRLQWRVPTGNGSVLCACTLAGAAAPPARDRARSADTCFELRRYANDSDHFAALWREAADEKIGLLRLYLEEIQRMEQELAALAQSERDAAWNARIGHVAKNIEISAQFLENLLAFVPGTANIGLIARSAQRTAARGYKALDRARTIAELKDDLRGIVKEESKLALTKFLLNLTAEFHPWLKVLKTIVDLARGIEERARMQGDIDAIAKVLAANRRQLESGLARLRQRMLQSAGWREIQRGVRMVADRYCSQARSGGPVLRQP